MFNKKEMKLIRDYKKVQQYLMEGTPVYLVQLDGSLVEITAQTDWKVLYFHNIKQGAFAVYRKKFTGLGEFCKSIQIGNWSLSVSHEKKGGDA